VLAACAWAWLAACRQPADATPASAGPRVVSLHDVTTEMVVALGAIDRLVGIAEPVDATPEVTRAVSHLPRVGSLESILPLGPEVVLGLGVVAEQNPDLVARLRERGIEVFLADPATLDDVSALLGAVAERTASRSAGERLAAEFRQQVEQGAPASKRRVRVFVYDCCDPPFTAGGKTVLNNLIDRAGGQNIFADLDADWAHVSWEEVVARRPELVVIHAYPHDGQADVPDKRRALQAIRSLADLPTTVVPLGCSLGGIRSAEGLQLLRAAIGDQT
jgi:ABC-type Fe3+-hydroxamate transport system substrate-binding protein